MGPDHVTIARFRADHHQACRLLFTEVLVLAAQLGLGRLETVALDGVKMASNASLGANRTRSGLAKAAEAEAARIAEAAIAAHAATATAEDEQFGADNPGLVPPELADEASRAAAIDEAIAALDGRTRVGPDDPVGHDDRPSSATSAELVAPQPVARDRAARIAQAQARIEAEITAERAERDKPAQQFLDRLAAGEKVTGRSPAGTEVARAEQRLAEAIAGYEARLATRHRRGRRPVPVEQYCRVRQAQAKLDKARAAQAVRAAAEAPADKRVANITDPQSRMQPVRGGGWVQGYNCQAVTTADGLIVATGVGTSPVDNQYYRDLIEKAVTAAELITSHHGPDSSGQAESIGIVLADAGYCTKDNLTAPGPDRLIATGKSRDLHGAAIDNPAEGPPPDDNDPIAAMNHRLRTPEGMATYAQRSHIAETPFGHAKHNLGFRRFTSRGLARARSEWDFHAAVHNIGKIITHLAGAPLPA
jgi:Transposase DDE domain